MSDTKEDDSCEPGNQEIAELERALCKLDELGTQSRARYEARKKKHGRKRAVSGIWKDNPQGTIVWKATIAGIAVAYQQVSGDQGHAIDLVAEAAGLANNARGFTDVAKSDQMIGLDSRSRDFSPGDRGKNVRRFIQEVGSSQSQLVQAEFERAKVGNLLFDELDNFEIYVGDQGPLQRPKILQSIKKRSRFTLEQALIAAKSSGKRTDVDIACDKLLLAAEAHGAGRYLFHQKRAAQFKP